MVDAGGLTELNVGGLIKLMCKERVIYVMQGERGFRGGAAGRSWVRFPMRSFEFFID